MIYALIESEMNGSVTTKINVTGVSAVDYITAKFIVQDAIIRRFGNDWVEVNPSQSLPFRYCLDKQEVPIVGILQQEPLKRFISKDIYDEKGREVENSEQRIQRQVDAEISFQQDANLLNQKTAT